MSKISGDSLAMRKKFLKDGKKKKKKIPSVGRKLSCVNISFFNFLMRERNWVCFKKAVKVVNECHLSGKVRSNKELVE